jgi:ABC-type bacteriocin/lantibiotic exporter with double-glycine peptidase domain
MTHSTLVNLLNVFFSYDGATPTLSGLDFTLKEGEVKYISGHSGCGKSTFLKILNRLVEPVAGDLQFGQKPYGAWDVKELRKNIQLVQQIPVPEIFRKDVA